MVLKTYGVVALQEHIRKQVSLAFQFKELVEKDERFTLFCDVIMGLVCFRYKGKNKENEELHRRINNAGRIHMTPAKVNNQYVLRFVVNSRLTESEDIEYAWDEILRHADELELEKKQQTVHGN